LLKSQNQTGNHLSWELLSLFFGSGSGLSAFGGWFINSDSSRTLNRSVHPPRVSVRSGRVLSVFGLPDPRHAFVDAVDLVTGEMFGIRPSSEKT
jgi:hypothetical protein